MNFGHEPVLFQETIKSLALKPEGIYVDCTLGAAGHSLGLLSAEPSIQLIGIDQDPEALDRAKYRLVAYNNQVTLIQDNFRNLETILSKLGIRQVQGILMDIGVSSPQLDDGERGFSYHQDARLDMRMNPEAHLDAWTIVNTYSQEELSKIIFQYGEERWAKRISEFIVTERQKEPINTTLELVDVIKKAVPVGARESDVHPGRRTFQALRIAVNDELGALEDALEQGFSVLSTGGRIAVITFHSLEDRIVKNSFNNLLGKCSCPPDFPICVCKREKRGKLVNRKPIVASKEEIETNPRARSAKLRVLERL